jgi:hypothetical protein
MTDQAGPRPASEKSGSNTLMVCALVGCGFLALVAVLLIGGGLFLWTNAREIAGDAGYEALERAVREADLPAEQESRLITELADVRDRFQSGEIGWEQMGTIAERVTDSAILPMGGVLVGQHLLESDPNLSQAEVADGRLQLERFARGVHEGDIQKLEVKALLKTIGEEQSEGNIKIKGRPDTQELRELVRVAREKADAADVSPDRFEVDLAAELRAIVQDVVGSGPAH